MIVVLAAALEPAAAGTRAVTATLAWQAGPAPLVEALRDTRTVQVTVGPPRSAADPPPAVPSALVDTWVEIRATDGCFGATVLGRVTPSSAGAVLRVSGERPFSVAQTSSDCRRRIESSARRAGVEGATLAELDLLVLPGEGERTWLLLRAVLRDASGRERSWFLGADWSLVLPSG